MNNNVRRADGCIDLGLLRANPEGTRQEEQPEPKQPSIGRCPLSKGIQTLCKGNRCCMYNASAHGCEIASGTGSVSVGKRCPIGASSCGGDCVMFENKVCNLFRR